MSTSLAILPQALIQPTSSPTSHRFWRLPNPSTGLPSLYLPDQSSIFQVQKISPDKQRSWFLQDQVLHDGSLLLFTPVDPVFLLLPALQAVTTSPARFLLPDQLFTTASTHPALLLPAPFSASQKGKRKRGSEDDELEPSKLECEDLVRLGEMEGIERHLLKICDVMKLEPSGLKAYRLSEPLLQAYLVRKINRLANKQTFDTFPALKRGLARDGLGDLLDGQEEKDEEKEKMETIKQEARQLQALQLLQPYLPPSTYASLLPLFPTPSFTSYLSSSLAHPSLGSSHSATEDLESIFLEKSQQAEKLKAEKKRKAGPVSQGVNKLKKADTRGMSKLSSFFGKTGSTSDVSAEGTNSAGPKK